MKKKKEVKNMIKNGRDFKMIVFKEEDGNIHSMMEKPNIKTWTQADFNIATSGAHVFANPEFNHVDFFKEGVQTHKEYPEVKGSANYGYTISGPVVII